MTDEKSTDKSIEKSTEQSTVEGAQAPQKTPTSKKSIAASSQPTNPLATPGGAPEMPPGESEIWPEIGETADGLEFTEEHFKEAVGYDESRDLKASWARRPSAWIEGPGRVELLIEGLKLLHRAAVAAKNPMRQIKAVIVKALPSVEMVIVAPADEGASGSIETRQEGKGALHFTISDILRDAGMQITSGYRELFPVKKVAKSPIGPGIAISLIKSLESKRLDQKKKEK